MIEESIKHGECGADKQRELREALLLPDTCAETACFESLHASAPLPSNVPSLRLPPILHRDLASHPLFRRAKWRRPKYTMEKFLESGTLQQGDDQKCKLFWEWLRRNERSIGSRERTKLADIAIWPDVDGNNCKLLDFCDPRSPPRRNYSRRLNPSPRTSMSVSQESLLLARSAEHLFAASLRRTKSATGSKGARRSVAIRRIWRPSPLWLASKPTWRFS